jgi:hypothetical protein
MDKSFKMMVPRGGLEPPRDCSLRILSPLRLPISPSGPDLLHSLRLALIVSEAVPRFEAVPGGDR